MLRRIGGCRALWSMPAVRTGDVEHQHCVGARVPEHGREVAPRQFQVLRIGAVTVEDGGNLAVAAGSPDAPLPVSVRTVTFSALPADLAIVSLCVLGA